MASKVCKVEGCDTHVYVNGFCEKHNFRFRKHGDPLGGQKTFRAVAKTSGCSVEGCDRPHYGKGMCKLHYVRASTGKHKDCGNCPQCEKQLSRPDAKFCSVSCSRKWNRRNGYLREEARLASVGKCVVDGCEKAKHAHDMCTAHAERVRKFGDPFVLKTRISKPHCTKCGAVKVSGEGSIELCGNCYHNSYYYRNHKKEKVRRRVRNSRVKKATPKWADLEAIARVYETCPQGHEVDHIVPIQSKKVCGLHVAWNLRHLPKRENRLKSNKHECGG